MSTGARNNSKPASLAAIPGSEPLPRRIASGKLAAMAKAAQQQRAEIG